MNALFTRKRRRLLANGGAIGALAGSTGMKSIQAPARGAGYVGVLPTTGGTLATNINPAEHFKAVAYTGTGATRDVAGVGFEPDFVWLKSRDTGTTAGDHNVYDRVRGINSGGSPTLVTSTTAAEVTYAGFGVTDTDSDGFEISGSGSLSNANSEDYIAWCFKAGGAGVANTDGSISSTVSANTEAGFSIVDFAGGAGTVGHGLNQAPDLIIEKKHDTTSDWLVQYSVVDGSNDYMRMNTTAAAAAAAVAVPTDSVFSPNVGADNAIAYCFHSVEGFSKVGSYTGDGGTNNYVELGFRPAFLMIKRTNSADDWVMLDSTRDPDNTTTNRLRANTSGAEDTNGTLLVDFSDEGFTLRGTNASVNNNGSTYIFLAFAEDNDTLVAETPDGAENFSTLDPSGSGTYSNGNLSLNTLNASGTDFGSRQLPSIGKVYWEVYCGSGTTSIRYIYVGYDAASATGSVVYRGDNGQKRIDGTFSSYGSTYTEGDVIGVAVDLDNSTVEFFKNGVGQGEIDYDYSGLTAYPGFGDGSSSANVNYTVNFGQDATFVGQKSPGTTYTDANGLGEFHYEPPAGFVGLYDPIYGTIPGSEEDPHFSDVSLLVKGDTLTDSSDNAHTLTANGNAHVDLDRIAFDGTGDYLTVANDASLDLGTGDFTIEMWVRLNTLSGNHYFCDLGTNGVVLNYNSGFRVYVGDDGSDAVYTTTTAFTVDTWYHVALTREGSTKRVFVDGAQVSSASTILNSSGDPLTIGAYGTGAQNYTNGDISDFRIVKGTALYTAAFTAPARGSLTAVTGTSLLIEGGSITDSSTNAHAITVAGNAAAVQAVTKYASGSLVFDGTGDYVSIPDDPAFELGEEDFTIELWAYHDGAMTGHTGLLGKRATEADYSPFMFETDNSASEKMRFFASAGSSWNVLIADTDAFPTSQWVHVAVTRQGNTFTLWINGVAKVTASASFSLLDNATPLYLGQSVGSPVNSNEWKGNIEDLRITKGIARYTADFTPPARTLPTQGLQGGGTAQKPGIKTMFDLYVETLS